MLLFVFPMQPPLTAMPARLHPVTRLLLTSLLFYVVLTKPRHVAQFMVTF